MSLKFFKEGKGKKNKELKCKYVIQFNVFF